MGEVGGTVGLSALKALDGEGFSVTPSVPRMHSPYGRGWNASDFRLIGGDWILIQGLEELTAWEILCLMSAGLVNHFNKVIYGDWRLHFSCLVNICVVLYLSSPTLKSPGLTGNNRAARLV